MANQGTAPRGFEAVRAYLDREGIRYDVVQHEPTFSAADEAHSAGIGEEAAAKTLAVRDREAYRLAVIPANRRLDLGRLRELLPATRHLRLATEEEMQRDLPAFEVGALPPFGPMLPAPEVVDVRLLYRDRVLCAGGDHRHSLLIDPRDLVRVAEPQVADICEHDEQASPFHELPHP